MISNLRCTHRGTCNVTPIANTTVNTCNKQQRLLIALHPSLIRHFCHIRHFVVALTSRLPVSKNTLETVSLTVLINIPLIFGITRIIVIFLILSNTDHTLPTLAIDGLVTTRVIIARNTVLPLIYVVIRMVTCYNIAWP